LHLRQETEDGTPRDINMIVPIDLLRPILDDLKAYGRVNEPARPWLGVYAVETDGKVIVADVAAGGPAAVAGLKQSDVIASVRDEGVDSLADFYRKLWSSGSAGVEIALEVVRDKRSMWLRLKSADRNSFLKGPKLQ